MSESLSEDVPAAVRACIDTTDAGDAEACVAAVTEDAFLADRGRQFVVTVAVSGNGSTSTSDLEFTVRGDRVARLVIAP